MPNINKTHMKLEDWSRLQDDCISRFAESAAQDLLAINELLKDMEFYGYTSIPKSRWKRLREWIAHKIVKLGFLIDPEVRDDYY